MAAVAVCPGGEFARAKTQNQKRFSARLLAVFGLMGLMSGAWLLTLYLMLGSLVLVGLTAFRSRAHYCAYRPFGAVNARCGAGRFFSAQTPPQKQTGFTGSVCTLLVPIIVMAQLRSRLIDTWQMQLPNNAANYFYLIFTLTINNGWSLGCTSSSIRRHLLPYVARTHYRNQSAPAGRNHP